MVKAKMKKKVKRMALNIRIALWQSQAHPG